MHTKRDNYALGAAGLAEGTNANTVKTSNILHFAIAGRAYVKAATDNIAFALKVEVPALAIPTTGASRGVVLFIFINAAGTVTYKPSATFIGVTGAGYVPGAMEWPADDASNACIGAVKVVANASGTFTPASVDLGAANQTVTYYDVADDLGVPIPY